MLEPEPPSFAGGHRLTPGEHLVEERLVQLPRPMGVGVGQRRAGWRSPHAEVNQLAESGGQAAAALAERMRTTHLTKQHRDTMIPTADPLGRSLGGMLPDGASEFRAIDQGEDLRKATGYGYHEGPPACGWHGADTPWMAVDEESILLTSRGCFKNVFGTRVGLTP